MMFSVDDIKRFPQVTRVHFIECSGNGRAAYHDPKPDYTPQRVAGLTSNTEWTGVPLKPCCSTKSARNRRRSGFSPKAATP